MILRTENRELRTGMNRRIAESAGERAMLKQRFFQIRKDGIAFDDRCYPSLPQAALSLEKAPRGSEVVEVDVFDRILQNFTPEECRRVTNRFLSPI